MAEPSDPVHLSLQAAGQPFVAACGADTPNQATTAVAAHVTCARCNALLTSLHEAPERVALAEAALRDIDALMIREGYVNPRASTDEAPALPSGAAGE